MRCHSFAVFCDSAKDMYFFLCCQFVALSATFAYLCIGFFVTVKSKADAAPRRVGLFCAAHKKPRRLGQGYYGRKMLTLMSSDLAGRKNGLSFTQAVLHIP